MPPGDQFLLAYISTDRATALPLSPLFASMSPASALNQRLIVHLEASFQKPSQVTGSIPRSHAPEQLAGKIFRQRESHPSGCHTDILP